MCVKMIERVLIGGFLVVRGSGSECEGVRENGWGGLVVGIESGCMALLVRELSWATENIGAII